MRVRNLYPSVDPVQRGWAAGAVGSVAGQLLRNAGALRHDEGLLVGLAAAPGALEYPFAGRNRGKLLIDISRADPPS